MLHNQKIKVGQILKVDVPKFRKRDKNSTGSGSWSDVYPFNARVISVDNTNTDIRFRILNERTGNILEVENKWFNYKETGRIVSILNL